MTEGTNIEEAFDRAMADNDLKNTAFLCYFTTEVTSVRCKALTAPAFRDTHGAASSGGRPERKREAGEEEGPSKRAKKREAAAKKKANGKGGDGKGGGGKGGDGGGRSKKKVKALMNGGVGDGAGAKGAGKAQLKQRTTALCTLGEDKSICFSHNNGTACKDTPCLHVHVCQICEAVDHTKRNCPNKK